MPARKIQEYLESQGVPYEVIDHLTTYTAQEVAASAHLPGKNVAKTVIVKLDGRFAMAVLPAPYSVDLEQLRDLTGSIHVELAGEEEFTRLFPGCEVGALPPFGNLFGLEVYVASDLAQDEWIAFSAGSHTQLIRMRYADFERLVQPMVLEFAMRNER
jgi:Ala-tRNA(Pro) deacylase